MYWGYAIALGTGTLVGYLLAQWKAIIELQQVRADRAKLQQEAIAMAGETLKNVLASRRVYIKSCGNLDRAIDRLDSALKSRAPAAEVRQARERVCYVFSHHVVARYHETTEWERLRLRHQPVELAEYMREFVIPQLRRWADWLVVFNDAYFTKKMGLAPYECHRSNFTQLYSMLNEVSRKSYRELKPHMTGAVDRIAQACRG